MAGSGQVIPTVDETEIGLPARHFLQSGPCNFLILIDDLEPVRRQNMQNVFHRYRAALDTMLQPDDQRRASVQFLVPMLEAYYFAHSAAVNQALGTQVLQNDSMDDVEGMGHAKNEIKRLHKGFDEMDDGAEIARMLDLDHVLNNPQTCGSLRSMVSWCVRRLLECCPVHDPHLSGRYQMPTGIRAAVTDNQ